MEGKVYSVYLEKSSKTGAIATRLHEYPTCSESCMASSRTSSMINNRQERPELRMANAGGN